MSSRIEQIIGEIEEYVDSCKFQPLSTTKIVVNKEEIEELLRELRLKTPDEIKRYQKIINNKDAILEDAQTKADALIADAQARAQELVTQHEIMQKALQAVGVVIVLGVDDCHLGKALILGKQRRHLALIRVDEAVAEDGVAF